MCINPSAGLKGGPGGHVPPPPEEAVSALKIITFFTHYMILRVLHTYMITDYPHNNSAERKGGCRGTDRAVSVARACK